MKRSFFACALVLGFSPLAFAPVAAQTPVAAPVANLNLLPSPQIVPPVLGASGSATIVLAPDYPLNTSRLRIAIYEVGRPARLAEIERDFAVVGERMQASFNLQASPGSYEIRVVAGDKARTPMSLPAPLVVPGIDRKPGWWLLNGSPFSSFGEDKAGDNPGTPFFIPGLKRDGKGKKTTQNIFVPATAPLSFKTLVLPSLHEMLAPNYDFTAMKVKVQKQIADAQAQGERGFVGFALPDDTELTSWDAPAPLGGARVITQVRQIVSSLAPDAALILSVSRYDSPRRNYLQSYAAQFDAVVVNFRPYSDSTWSIKTFRRAAEEQPNYDLPIFVKFVPFSFGAGNTEMPKRVLDTFMAGATGLDSDSRHLNSLNAHDWIPIVNRNLPMFVGSVTLEDIGILPSPDDASMSRDETLYETLRGAGRIPLLARLKSGKDAESLAVSLGNRISAATIEALRAAATDGARIYIEGAPTHDETGKETGWRLGSLVGGSIKKGEGTPEKGRTFMTLEDGWTFGTGRGTRVDVEQDVTVTVNKGTVVGQAKQEKGKYLLTEPRVAARLADGTPALIINPVGKGEVIWMPHRVVAETEATDKNAKSGAARLYYAAVAAYVQPALVQLRGTDARLAGAANVRAALRRSARGTMLLALFNDADRPAAVAASIDGAAGVALDLATQRELPLAVRGFSSEASVTIAPHGWTLIAFAQTRKALDEERNAPRLQAKLR